MKTRGLAALVSVALVTASLGAAAISRLGPPTICFRYEVADPAKCLAEKRDDVVLAGAPVAKLVGAAIDSTEDVLTRMESLRRAFFWTKDEAERDAVTAALEHRVVIAELRDDASSRARAVAWFTLGYWRQVVAEGSRERFGSEDAYLEKALRLDATDPAMHFGAAITAFRERSKFYSRVAKAHALNESAGGEATILGKNLVVVLGDLAPELTKDGYARMGELAAKEAAVAAAAGR